MSKELVISANRHETRVALIEDDQVVEVYHQRENEYSLAGSIHKGRVTRVLPGMQSAFVDIGLDRDAFLYVSDFFEDNDEYDKIVTSVEEKVLKLDRVPSQQPGAPAVEAAAPVAEAAGIPEAIPVPEPEMAAAPPAVLPVQSMAMPANGQANPDSRRDDRDRRGRRGRRRRGQKPSGGGGRGLPESKFYSPGSRPVESRPVEEFSAAPEALAAEPREAEADDFFVLPGESLAKYRGPGGAEEEDQGEDIFDREAESESASGEIEENLPEPKAEAPEVAGEGATELSSEAPSEPLPELSVVAAEVLEDVDVAPEPELEAEPEPEAEAEPEREAPEAAEIPAAESVTEPVAAAEPLGDTEPILFDPAEPVESTEPEEPVEAAGSDESDESAAGPEPGDADVTAEEEGPEPARIPTSLTAALREQGPRYLHRVSRRTRRRGRDGRGQQEGRPNESGQSRPETRENAPVHPRPETRTAPVPRPEPRPEKSGAPSISDLLKEGQEIIVQIAKEPLGQKGARITSHIALPGRFLVYMPTVDHIGVSRKIPSDEERSRLKRVLQNNRAGVPGGYIVRTAGEGRTEEELRADMMFLYNLWLDMRQKAERRPAPMLIHHDLNVVERILRDQLTSQFKSIWVDNEEVYEAVLSFVQRFQPALVARVKMYTRSNPIFDEFNITSELEKALRPKVWLKSGGYIVINQTEALVAIDINTGKFVGKSNRLEDTIVKTNTDAIKEIVRQIRLRDLGGIIVVDFIDMDERKNRQKVMQALEEAMRADRAPYKILQFNDFGLVAITRKRVKQSLERTLCTPCPYCEGAGYVKSPQTVIGEILQEANKIARAVEGKDVMLRVNTEVARLLKSNQNTFLQEIEEILGRTVIVKSDPQLHQEKFDLA